MTSHHYVLRVLLALAPLLASCSHADSTKPVSVGLVVGATNRGYSSYEDAANQGLRDCATELGARVSITPPTSNDDPERQAILLATENADAIIAVGDPMREVIAKVARRFENSHFTLIDAAFSAPNIESIVFDEVQAGELAGALAALGSKTQRVAFIGGGNDPHVEAYERGFTQGARAVRPAIRIEHVELGSFTDSAASAAAAARLAARGTDTFFAVSGAADSGVIAGAKNYSPVVIVTDQSTLAGNGLIASVDKNVREAAKRACEESVSQKPSTGTTTLGVAQKAIALHLSTALEGRIGAAGLKRLNDVQASLARQETRSTTH